MSRHLFAAGVAVLALSACGGEADIPQIQREVESGILDQMGVKVSVDCPDQIDWQNGQDFYCFAEAADGTSSRVTITMANDAGEWSWAFG